MIDLDIRALQVKRLDEIKLAILHRRERERGARLMPWEIGKDEKQDIKTFYGVPAKGGARRKTLRKWGETVRQVIGRFVREQTNNMAEKVVQISLEDLDTLHAFDRAVWSSDLDFHWRTATPAKRARAWYEPD